LRALTPAVGLTVAAEDDHGTAQQVDGRMGFQILDLLGQPVGIHDVVTIHPSEVLASGHFDALVQLCRQTPVRIVVEYPNARIYELPCHSDSVIPRTVI